MPQINFFEEDISYTLKSKKQVREWVTATIMAEGYILDELNYIFCSDDYLLTINKQYLDHDTYTDIVTFDNSVEKGQIIGDIFISIDRIRDNAARFKQSVQNELHRVIIHGALHLVGFKDKSAADSKKMTQKEDEYLAKRSFNA